MTELVSSGYFKSNTPRADRRQAAVVSCWNKGERESREKVGGSEWMRKEEGKVRMSNEDTHTAQDQLTHTPYNTTRLHAHPPTNAPTHTTTHMYTHKSCNTITSPCWSTSYQSYSSNVLYHSTMTGAGVSQEQGEEGRG